MRNIYCLWMMILLCFYGCKKEENFNFVNPSIRLLKAEVVVVNQGEVKLRIELGAGFKGHKAWVQMTDISEITGGTTVYPVALTEEVIQEHTLTIQPPAANHDYQIMAVLETGKNRFETEKQYLFFTRKSHLFDIGSPSVVSGDSNYDAPFLEGMVYAIRQPGDVFLINLHNQSYFKVDEIKVTLNESIPIECDYNKSLGNPNETVIGKLPDNLAPGDYSVQIYLDGEKWNVNGLVRVLPWKSELIELDSNHGYYFISTSFQVNDEIFYIQYLDHNFTEFYSEFKVWSYHIPTGTWTDRKNWISTEVGNPKMGVGLGDKGYSLFSHDFKTCLWSYSPETDEWKQLSYYPGKGFQGFTMFAADGYIYIGGGVSQKDNQSAQQGVPDFWRYEVQTGKWEQLPDLPFTPKDRLDINSTCTDGTKAYTFLSDRSLWCYDTSTASWSQEESLRQGPYFRHWASLCIWEGKVCLIGGEYDSYQYTDIQLYDPVTRQWSLKEIYNFRPWTSSSYIPSIHQWEGSIFMGPLQQWGTYDRPAPRFIKITPQ